MVMPKQPEQLLPSTALTARTMPWLTSAPCQPARSLSTMMPDHQPPGHGVLAQAAISRTPPELNGIKWQQMALSTKIRIWDVATSYKKATKKWRDVCKSLQKPGFSWSNSAISREKPRPLPTVRRPELSGTKWQQMALFKKTRIWDDATSYKKATKNGVICAKACKNPTFPGQKAPFSGKIPVSRHPRRSGDPEPLLSATRLENGSPALAPAASLSP